MVEWNIEAIFVVSSILTVNNEFKNQIQVLPRALRNFSIMVNAYDF